VRGAFWGCVVRAAVASATSEKVYQQQIADLATLLGWSHFHTFDSRRSDVGWPDLILCRPPRLIAAELKGPRGRLTFEQEQWLSDLAECGLETYVWRSGQDSLQAIARVLR
jgi:hypothetical protein